MTTAIVCRPIQSNRRFFENGSMVSATESLARDEWRRRPLAAGRSTSGASGRETPAFVFATAVSTTVSSIG